MTPEERVKAEAAYAAEKAEDQKIIDQVEAEEKKEQAKANAAKAKESHAKAKAAKDAKKAADQSQEKK